MGTQPSACVRLRRTVTSLSFNVQRTPPLLACRYLKWMLITQMQSSQFPKLPIAPPLCVPAAGYFRLASLVSHTGEGPEAGFMVTATMSVRPGSQAPNLGAL